MDRLTEVNGFHIHTALRSGYERLVRERIAINRLNVFPVPDGDTGNNLVATMRAVVTGPVPEPTVHQALKNIADAAVSGARGNSGLILAQFLSGLCAPVGEKALLTTVDLAYALENAALSAEKAVESPVEGTMLTVLRDWARSFSRQAGTISDFKLLFPQSLEAIRSTLEKTRTMLPENRRHRSVDAGAQGVVSMIEGICAMTAPDQVVTPDPAKWERGEGERIPEADMEIPYRYCTEVLLDTSRINPESLRPGLEGFGDSIILTAGITKSRLHIHTNDPEGLFARICKRAPVLGEKVDDMVRQRDGVHRPLSKIAIVTDSIADIPLALLDSLQIHVIPQRILWGGETYLDRLTLSVRGFYDRAERESEFPTSSLPDPATIQASLDFLSGNYESILMLPVAAALSGTKGAMERAASDLRERAYPIAVIDTRLNSAAQGLLVLEAARLAAEGLPFETLLSRIEALREGARILVGVNTFDFMVRGGRVSPLKGLLARLLHLKPIVSLDKGGKGIAFGAAFSQKALLRKLEKSAIGAIRSGKGKRWAVVHADSPEKAEELAGRISRATGTHSEYLMEISPIVAMHAGQGAVAVAWIG